MTLDEAMAVVAHYALNPAQQDVLAALLTVLKETSPSADLDLFPIFMHVFTDSMCFDYTTQEETGVSSELYSSDLLTRVQDLFVAKCLLYDHAAREHEDEAL